MIIHFQKYDFNIFLESTDILESYERRIVEFCKNWIDGISNFEVQTSGSTGIPKKIIISRAQALASVSMTKAALGLQAGWDTLLCLDSETIAGRMMLIRAMEIGMNLHVVPPSSNPFAQVSPTASIDFVAMVPLQIATIISKKYNHLLNQCKVILLGGTGIADTLIEQILQLTIPVYSAYGMTETVSHIALQLLNTERKQTTYQKLPSIEIKKDTRSCLCVRGAVTAQEWVVTNDVVELLEDGYFIIKGRIDNIINSGGIKIQLEEVEKFVFNYFNISLISNRFFASAIPEESLGEELILVIEDHKWTDEMQVELLTYLKENCPKYKAPKKLFFAPKFKETLSQKIDKKATLKSAVANLNL